MGAEASTESGEEFLKVFSNKYSFYKELNDSRFGDIQIYREKGGEGEVFLKSHWCQSEEDYNRYLQQCNQKANSVHNNILRLIGFTQSSDMQLCGDFSKITVYYEYYSHNMEDELDRRNTRSEFFNEQEIWFLLDSIISAGAYFEQNKQAHGDIRPRNILLTNKGFVKIADNSLLNHDKNGYINALQYGEQSYLSPQLMQALAGRELQPKHNPFKSDVFSVGMTILQVCCLYTARACYDYTNCRILQPVIDDLMNRARGRYSQFLINIIQELLQIEEANRPSFQELQTLLAPYQESIQNLIPFNPDYSLVKRSQVVAPPQQQQFVSQVQQQQPYQQQQQQQNPVHSQIIQQQQPQYVETSQALPQPNNLVYSQTLPTVPQTTQQQPQQVYLQEPLAQTVTYVNQQQQQQEIPQQQQPVQQQYVSYQPQGNVQSIQQPIGTQSVQPSTVQTVYDAPTNQQYIIQQLPDQQQQQQQQYQVYQQPLQQQQQTVYQQQVPVQYSNGSTTASIDQRVQDALKTSEQTILQHNSKIQQYQ